MNPRFIGAAAGDPEMVARRAERINFDTLARMYGTLSNMAPQDGWELAAARRRIEAAKRRWAASLVQLDAMNGSGGPA